MQAGADAPPGENPSTERAGDVSKPLDSVLQAVRPIQHLARSADAALTRGFSFTKRRFARQFRRMRLGGKKSARRARRLWTRVHRGNRLCESELDALTNNLGVCLQFVFTANEAERTSSSVGKDHEGEGAIAREVYGVKGLELENGEPLPKFAYVVEAPKQFMEIRRAWGMDERSYAQSFELNGLKAKFIDVSVVDEIKQGLVTAEGGRLKTSTTSLQVISRQLASGKSKSWFFCSEDGTLLVKTCNKREKNVLLGILPAYTAYVKENSTTSMLPQFYGLYTLKFDGTRPLSFIVMNYWFASSKVIKKRFDLKGSTHGRSANPAERAKGKACIYKDNDFTTENAVRTKHSATIVETLRKDTEFLRRQKLMDYSMVFGEYEAETPKDIAEAMQAFQDFESTEDWANVQRSAAVVVADMNDTKESETSSQEEEALSMESDDLIILEKVSMFTPFVNDIARINQLRAVNKPNGAAFVGIIDILNRWRAVKKTEWFFHGALCCGEDISCQNPKKYARRFVNFMSNNVFLPAEATPLRSIVEATTESTQTES